MGKDLTEDYTDKRRYSGKKEGKKNLTRESRKLGKQEMDLATDPATAGQMNAASAFGLYTEHPGLTPFDPFWLFLSDNLLELTPEVYYQMRSS